MKQKLSLHCDLVFSVTAFIVCLLGRSCCSEVDNSKTLFMRYASSRTAISRIVFKGRFIGLDKTSAPNRVLALFRTEMLLKGLLGSANPLPKKVWVASFLSDNQFDCLTELNNLTNYIVYLNGSFNRIWITDSTPSSANDNVTESSSQTTQRILQQNKVFERKVYWISAQPQEATEKRLREVEKYCCEDCSRKPEVQLVYSNKTVDSISRVTLKCSLIGECKLFTLFLWFRYNDVIAKNEQGEGLYSIENRKFSSYLIIDNFNSYLHRGKYHCQAINILGRKSTHELFLPRVVKESGVGLSIFLLSSLIIVFLIFIALIGIICCFSRLKRGVNNINTSPSSQQKQVSQSGEDHVDLELKLDNVAEGKLESLSQYDSKDSSKIKDDGSDLKTFSTLPHRVNGNNSQPSPLFSTLRWNYKPLEGPEKGDKPIPLSPHFGRAGQSYKPLKFNKSSSFIHYVIGPPVPVGSDSALPKSTISTISKSTRKSDDQPPTSDSESNKADPKLEEELQGILKELGDYVNYNQKHSHTSDSTNRVL